MGKYKVVMFFFFLMINFVSEARLGETINMCRSRYGASQPGFYRLLSGDNTETLDFSYEGWTIRVGFFRKFAAMIQYTRNTKISDSEIQSIFKAYQAEPWQEIRFSPSSFVSNGWRSKQGYIAYISGVLGNTLTIEWPEQLKKLKEEKNDAKKHQIKKEVQF